MKLSTAGISILKGNKAIWERVREVLGVSKPTMYRLVKLNHEDLTKAAAMIVLRKDSGLTDFELLEPEKQIA